MNLLAIVQLILEWKIIVHTVMVLSSGTGTIDGRNVAIYSQDFTVMGGGLGEVFGEKMVKIATLALKNGVPLIGIE